MLVGMTTLWGVHNDQPQLGLVENGFISIGWSEVGRPTLHALPAGPTGLLRMRSARAAAEKWSEQVTVGQPAADLADRASSIPGSRTVVTEPVPGFTAWRYGFEPLHYRAVDVKGGQCVFRVRRRGGAKEVAIVEWRSTRRDPGAVFRLTRELGDYAVLVAPPARSGLIPLPGRGPIVTWRPLATPGVPALADLGLQLTDLELF